MLSHLVVSMFVAFRYRDFCVPIQVTMTSDNFHREVITLHRPDLACSRIYTRENRGCPWYRLGWWSSQQKYPKLKGPTTTFTIEKEWERHTPSIWLSILCVHQPSTSGYSKTFCALRNITYLCPSIDVLPCLRPHRWRALEHRRFLCIYTVE